MAIPKSHFFHHAFLLLVLFIGAGLVNGFAHAAPNLDSHLTLEITADSESVSPGQTITVTLTLTNNGPDLVENIRIENDYDQATITIDQDRISDLGQDDKDKITWQVEAISRGSSITLSYSAAIKELPPAGQIEILNFASVYENNQFVTDADLTLAITPPEITITKTADVDSIIPGESITFTVKIENQGTVIARNVVVKDNFDQNSLTVEVIQEDSLGNIGERDIDVITWNIGDLEPNGNWEVSYQVSAAEAFSAGTQPISNTVSVSANSVDIAQMGMSLPVQVPQLSLTRHFEINREVESADSEGPTDNLLPGDVVTFTLNYSNNGNEKVSNIILIETFNQAFFTGIKKEDITNGGQLTGNTITWNLGDLDKGEGGELSYQAIIMPALGSDIIEESLEATDKLELRHIATIIAKGMEPISESDIITILLMPILSIERIEKDINGGELEAGDSILITLNIINSGQGTVQDEIILIEDFNEDFGESISQISSGGENENGMIEWSIPGLSADENMFSYEIKIRDNISKSIETIFEAALYIQGVPIIDNDKSITIAPRQESNGTLTTLFQSEITLSVLVFLIVVLFLYLLWRIVYRLIEAKEWKPEYFSDIVDLLVAIFILAVVVILSANNTLPVEGTIGILSGIAGYMLGRRKSN